MKAVRCVLLALVLAPSLRAEEKPVSFWDQKEAVLAAAFSPDSRFLATASGDDRSISIWDMETMLRKQHITDTGRMHYLLYAPDGKSIVVAGEGPISDKPVLVVIPLDGGKRRYLEMSFAGLVSPALSPDGKHLAAAGEKGLVDLLDVASGKRLHTLNVHGHSVYCVLFSPDGKTLLTSAEPDPVIRLWDVATGKEKQGLKGHKFSVVSMAFGPDAKTLVSAGGFELQTAVGELFTWDLVTGRGVTKRRYTQWVQVLDFTPDGRTLVIACLFGAVKLEDWPDGKERQSLLGPGRITGLCQSRDGRWILAFGGSHDPYQSIGGLRFWDAKTGRQKLAPALEAERDRREKILGEQGKRQELARAARDNTEREGYWKHEGERRADRQRRAEYALAIHQVEEALDEQRFRDARKLLDGLRPKPGIPDLRGFEWHYLNGRVPKEVVLREGREELESAVTPDGALVALTDWNREVALIDGLTGRTRTHLKGFDKDVAAMAFSPDGSLLAVAEYAGENKSDRVTLWNVGARRRVAELPNDKGNTFHLVFSPDGNFLAATGNAGLADVWDVRRQKLAHAFGKQKEVTWGAAFSPDGKSLVVSGGMAGLSQYDLTTGKGKALLANDGEFIGKNVSYSSDGRFVMADGEHGPVLWDADSGKRLGNLKEPYLRRLDVTDRDVCRVVTDSNGTSLFRFPRTAHRAMVRMELRQFNTFGNVCFSDNGRELLAGGQEDQSVLRCWDVATATERVLGGDGLECYLEFDGNAGKVRVGDDTLTLPPISRMKRVVKHDHQETLLHALSPHGQLVLTDASRKLTIRDSRTGKARADLAFVRGRALPAGFGAGDAGSAAFSADGRTLYTYFADATNSATDVIAWDTNTGKETGRIVAPGYVNAMRMDSAGKAPAALMIWNPDRAVSRNWDVETGEYTFELLGNTVEFSPDGVLVAASDGLGNTRLHDAISGHVRTVYRHQWQGYHIAFRPDGKALAVAAAGVDWREYRIHVFRVPE